MSRSLRTRLTRPLAALVLGAGLIAAAAAFVLAYSEAREYQDDTLRQVAALAVGNPADIARLQAAGSSVGDPDARILLVRLPRGERPPWLPADIGPGLHTLATGRSSADMRVFVRADGHGGRLVAAQSTESRNESARNSALLTLLPIVVLLPLLLLFIRQVVGRELGRVAALAEAADRQPAGALKALPDRNLPAEIAPFVAAINRLLGRVDQMMGAQRRFIADAAHELRTPLTALSLQAQNAAAAETPELLRERLVPLQEGIERARKLTTQLLDLARMQARAPVKESVDPAALARELLAELHPLAELRGLDIGIDDQGVQAVRSDPHALRLILRNGLENALKYTPAGGCVTLSLETRPGSLVMAVSDNGPGIDPAMRAAMFTPFRRASGGGEGSGLGLAIAREAARRLGGDVELDEPAEGSGLVFRLRLPLD